MKTVSAFILILLCSGLVSSCGEGASKGKDKPDKISPSQTRNTKPESALTTITLTQDGARRTGVETGVLEKKPAVKKRMFAGVVAPAPAASAVVAAPFDGIVTPLKRDLPIPGAALKRGQAVLGLRGMATQMAGISPDQAIAVRKVELQNARNRLKRTLELVEAEGASVEEAEFARADVAQATAAYESLLAQVTMGTDAASGSAVVSPVDGVLGDYVAGIGQMVRAGDPLFRVTTLSDVLVRVPVFPSDLGRIGQGARAQIARMGASKAIAEAARIAGPPTATQLASSIDLYFMVRAPGVLLRPGERLSVMIPMEDETPKLLAPLSSIFTDIHGGTWVYEVIGDNTFTRRRVWIDYVLDRFAVLARGPAAGTQVVTVGVAELAGVEFGVGK